MNLTAAPASARSIDRTIAKINDDIITESDLSGIIADINGQYSTLVKQPFEVATTETVESMLDRSLFLQEARRMKISPPEDELQRQVEEMVREIKSNFSTEKEFYQALAGENISLGQLKQELLKKTKTDYLVYQVVDSRYSVSDQEVAGFTAKQQAVGEAVTSYRLRRLGVPIKDKNDTLEASRRARTLVARIITDSISFEEGIRRYSQVAGAAVDGGDMGYMSSDKLSTEVRAAVENLEIGQASVPVVAGGYANIFYMEGKRGARSALREQKFFDAKTELLADLRRKAILQVFDDRLHKILPDNYRAALTGSSFTQSRSTPAPAISTPVLRAPAANDQGIGNTTPPTQYPPPQAAAPSPTPQQRRFPQWFGNRQ